MARKKYEWIDGAKLQDHSRRKHKILREYFRDYLTVRCQIPQQGRFRLAIVDGFSGGGRYQCGTAGSPLIFIEELRCTTERLNLARLERGLGAVDIECLLVFNDASRDAISELTRHVTPLQMEIKKNCKKLHLRVEYLNDLFETAYPEIKNLLKQGRYRSVLFNLDQCGDRHVEKNTIIDIMHSYHSPEIFYTFVISSLLAFLRKDQPEFLMKRLSHLGLDVSDVESFHRLMNRNEWLGTAERLVFDTFRPCARYVSPFSINNPEGWRYWLIHFANVYRARQVYNNILHDNASLQAHFGRSGLNMLSYDPRRHDGILYLFDDDGRSSAKHQLQGDIPRLISETGDVMSMMDFYESIYNTTPAHSDDVHSAIIEHPDLEVITPVGGARRRANTISISDIIKVKKQSSFFPMFLDAPAWTRE